MIVTRTPSQSITEIFNRESNDSHVIIVHGFGIKIRILDGQLTIEDGIGHNRRTRQFPKVNRTIKRVVMTSQDGYISLESLRWCAEHGISIATFDPDCELISQYDVSETAHHVSMIRHQVHSFDTDKSLDIAREIEERKLTGQCSNLIRFFSGDPN